MGRKKRRPAFDAESILLKHLWRLVIAHMQTEKELVHLRACYKTFRSDITEDLERVSKIAGCTLPSAAIEEYRQFHNHPPFDFTKILFHDPFGSVDDFYKCQDDVLGKRDSHFLGRMGCLNESIQSKVPIIETKKIGEYSISRMFRRMVNFANIGLPQWLHKLSPSLSVKLNYSQVENDDVQFAFHLTFGDRGTDRIGMNHFQQKPIVEGTYNIADHEGIIRSVRKHEITFTMEPTAMGINYIGIYWRVYLKKGPRVLGLLHGFKIEFKFDETKIQSVLKGDLEKRNEEMQAVHQAKLSTPTLPLNKDMVPAYRNLRAAL